jgi:hypothetical protein
MSNTPVNRRNFLRLSTGAATAAILQDTILAQATPKPNIVLIIADPALSPWN